MDYYITTDAQPLSSSQIVMEERRAVPRKPLHGRVTLRLGDNTTVQGHGVDLSSGGVRLAADRALPSPLDCTIEFTIKLDGRPHTITCKGRVLSCVCTGMDGFTIGVQFVQLNEVGKAAVAQALR